MQYASPDPGVYKHYATLICIYAIFMVLNMYYMELKVADIKSGICKGMMSYMR
jgi:hypothetical protein